ncbi:MAG: MotA/TolQ/ExbB proton channel family protein [Lachnospiraceae bacterium]|nr:MotA/TolQ/ExbB proton channel family protein [Lachnospiraceae bacterium]
MDLASVIGLVVSIILIIVSIALGDAGIAGVLDFLDAPSALITFGGAFCAVLTSYSVNDFLNGFKTIQKVIKAPTVNVQEMIVKIIELSNLARKEGLLSLEEAVADLDDAFLKKGILLIVDGTDPELVRAIMETELVSIDGRHKKFIGFWETIASMGPAWGMIGTLIGLINMLGALDDPSTIGPAMAVALITTLYGSMLANWIAIPISNKLKGNNDLEMMIKEIMIEGLLSIQAGENPRVIEEKLKSFLAPSERKLNETEGDGGEVDG